VHLPLVCAAAAMPMSFWLASQHPNPLTTTICNFRRHVMFQFEGRWKTETQASQPSILSGMLLMPLDYLTILSLSHFNYSCRMMTWPVHLSSTQETSTPTLAPTPPLNRRSCENTNLAVGGVDTGCTDGLGVCVTNGGLSPPQSSPEGDQW